MNKFTRYTGACLVVMSQVFAVSTSSANSAYQNDQYVQQGNTQASSYQLNEAELAQNLAPIALYPDSLLSHIMIASTYPLDIVQAQRWRNDNLHLDAATAVEQAQTQGWDPSVTALIAFPSVLEHMNADLQWTQTLGNAFLEDEERVLNAVQALRVQAQQANSLKHLENMRVSNVNQQIIIEPARQNIIYVPYYDTRVVYGNWHWRSNPPVFWNFRPHLALNISNRGGSHFRWSAGININFDFFFSAFNWHSRHIVVTSHRNSRQYRSHSKMLKNYGAQRWQHQPRYQRRVGYRTHKANVQLRAKTNKNTYVKNRNIGKSQGNEYRKYSSTNSKNRHMSYNTVQKKLSEKRSAARSNERAVAKAHNNKVIKSDRNEINRNKSKQSANKTVRNTQSAKQVRTTQVNKQRVAKQKVRTTSSTPRKASVEKQRKEK